MSDMGHRERIEALCERLARLSAGLDERVSVEAQLRIEVERTNAAQRMATYAASVAQREAAEAQRDAWRRICELLTWGKAP